MNKECNNNQSETSKSVVFDYTNKDSGTAIKLQLHGNTNANASITLQDEMTINLMIGNSKKEVIDGCENANSNITTQNKKNKRLKERFEKFLSWVEHVAWDFFLIFGVASETILLQGANYYLKNNFGLAITLILLAAVYWSGICWMLNKMKNRNNLEIIICIIVALASSLSNTPIIIPSGS